MLQRRGGARQRACHAANGSDWNAGPPLALPPDGWLHLPSSGAAKTTDSLCAKFNICQNIEKILIFRSLHVSARRNAPQDGGDAYLRCILHTTWYRCLCTNARTTTKFMLYICTKNTISNTQHTPDMKHQNQTQRRLKLPPPPPSLSCALAHLTPCRCNNIARSIVHTLRVPKAASSEDLSASRPSPLRTICTQLTPQSHWQLWLTWGACRVPGA